jgi:hypothetical protein
VTGPDKPQLEVVDGDGADLLLRLLKLHVRAAHLTDEEIVESEALTAVVIRRADLKLIKGGLDGQPNPDSQEQENDN